MAEQLKIIPLGGLNEIGKNMTVYEYGGEIIVIDCGMAFPGDDMYGIDCVIPDVSYLVKHKNRIRLAVGPEAGQIRESRMRPEDIVAVVAADLQPARGDDQPLAGEVGGQRLAAAGSILRSG